MDACGEIVDTSDAEEREILKTRQQPDYYEDVWGSIKPSEAGNDLDDGETTFQSLLYATPSTTALLLGHTSSSPIDLRDNVTEDLIPYSLEFSQPSLNLKVSEVLQPSEHLPNNGPNSSQDPICLFSFPSSPDNMKERSRTPLTPSKIVFPSEILTRQSVPRLQTEERATEFRMGPAPEELEVLRSDTPSKQHSSHYFGLSPLSPVSAREHVQEFTEISELSPLHDHSEHGEYPPISSSPNSLLNTQSLLRTLPFTSPPGNDDLPNRPCSPDIIPPDPDPPSRKYSLRNRTAKQLNPFEYDKRQYKQQFRHMPEAIVRKTLIGGGRREHREDEDDDWVESQYVEQEEESQMQEVRQNEEERRRRIEHRRKVDQLLKDLDLTLPSSDDELESIGGLAMPNDTNHADDAQRTRGKRKRAVRPFPLKASEVNDCRHRQEPRDASPILQSRQSAPSRASVPDVDLDMGIPADDDYRALSLDNSEPLEIHVPSTKSPSPSVRSVQDSSDEEPSKRGSKRLRRGPRSHHGSDIVVLEEPHLMKPESTPETDSESSASNHHMPAQERILRRFLPAGIVKKFLEQDNHVSGRTRPRNDTKGKAGSDDVRPGHGRKRIASPNSRDPSRYQIKGDTESESDSPSRSKSKDIIEISDEPLSEGEEDIELLEKHSEGSLDLDGDELQDWLTGYPRSDVVGRAQHRHSGHDSDHVVREPELIDRMLQRTRRVGPVRSSERQIRNAERSTSTANRAKIPNTRRAKPNKLYQTKLAFEPIGKASSKRKSSRENILSPPRMHIPGSDIEARQQCIFKQPPKKKWHRRTRPNKYQNVYFTRNDGFGIVSGRSRPVIQVDLNDQEFHDALAPEILPPRRVVPHKHRTSQLISHFRNATNAERDEFDTDVHGPSIQKISLDFNIQPIPAGITLTREGYIGKGRLFELIAFLKEPTPAFDVPPIYTLSDISLHPDKPIATMSMDLAVVFDKLYNVTTLPLEMVETINAIGETQCLAYALRQLVTYKILNADEDEANHTITIISEQAKHLLARIDEKLQLVSADGHSLDFRSFDLYWLIVELHLRIAYARQRRPISGGASQLLNTHIVEEYATQLLQRLLEYDADRIMKPLQRDGLTLDKNSPDMRVLEYWICVLHTSSFLSHSITSPGSSFWRLLEAALELQSNKPDSPLAESERIWKTVFTINAFTQFSIEGISKPLGKVDAHWPIISKVLQSIRLNADPQRDGTKPAATIQKRDAYLRLVTARCYTLSSRWHWDTDNAEGVFRELCSIFRSREFGNLLGEPDDFPSFIRDRNESLCHSYSTTDTAYAILLKLVIHAVQNFHGEDRMRAIKVTRLLSLVVPVGATSFSKTSPPLDGDLSKLYNRYAAIYVAIYVDPSEKQIRSRLQQVRRYINFKLADPDSRVAAVRAMMYIAILLRHLRKPLADVFQWASEIVDDLLTEHQDSQVKNDSHSDINHIVLLVHTVLGTLRFIMDTPTLDRSASVAAEYPDMAYLQVWMPRILSSPLVKDHRTGLEVCLCIQKFLTVRARVIPLPVILRPRLEESQESQDDYGECDLDMNDPTLLALFDQSEPVNENHAADQQTSEMLDTFSSKLYSGVCMHLGCSYREIDAWLEAWLGLGKILVQNQKRQWDYYLKLAESAWEDIKDPFRRIYIRLRCMLTILKLDPNLYKTRATDFVRLGLEALISPKITLEHEYISLLFSIDSLSHILLRQILCTVDPTSGLFNLDKTSFLDKRLEFIAKIFHNASLNLELSPAADILALVEVVLTRLYQWKKEMFRNGEHNEYEKFAEDTLALARSHDIFLQRFGPCLPDLAL